MKGFRLEAFWVGALLLSVHVLMSACMQVRTTSPHKQGNGIGSIQSSMIHCQRDYSLQWHFCTRVDSPSFRFRWIQEKAALPGAEGAALSFSAFYRREFGSQLQSQNPLISLLLCKDSAMRQSGLWHQYKPVLDVQIFQNIYCWGPIKLTPVSRAARTCTGVLFVCHIVSWCCHLGCRVRRNQVWAKQHLVTEAGQRGCWDTQRLNRQPACHPLFFSSP